MCLGSKAMTDYELNRHLRLILSKETSDLETCWMQGYALSQKIKNKIIDPERDNPYPENSKASQYWLEGFDNGLFGEAPLFPEKSVELANRKVEFPQKMLSKIYQATLIFGGIAVCLAVALDFVA
jgi:hypothetical protein